MADHKRDADFEAFEDFIAQAFEEEKLMRFVRQSNAIEGLDSSHDEAHAKALRKFLALDQPTTADVIAFVAGVAPHAKLRDRKGRNVLIRLHGGGEYRPPAGSRHLAVRLAALVEEIAVGTLEPAEAHVAFEALHPFTDGNGRTGRALWAWHMRHEGLDPFALTFLHRFYYQSLELARRALPAP